MVIIFSHQNNCYLISDLYNEPANSTSDAINKLKQFYNACMDTDALNRLNSSILLNQIQVTNSVIKLYYLFSFPAFGRLMVIIYRNLDIGPLFTRMNGKRRNSI